MGRRQGLKLGAALAAVLVLALLAAGSASAEPRRYLEPVFGEVETVKNLVYGSAVDNYGSSTDLRLDLRQPAGDRAPRRPVVVVAYGGGFSGGDKTNEGVSWMGERLAERGFVALNINYRLRPPGSPGAMSNSQMLQSWQAGVEPPQVRDARHDFAAAVRWARANAERFRLDPAAIVGLGSSAGGVTAIGAAIRQDDVGGSGNPGFSSAMAAVTPSSAAWPATDVDGDEPPTLMLNGDRDTTVPYAFAVDTCAAINARGGHCELITREGVGHNTWDHRDQFLAETTRFACERVVALAGCGVGTPSPPDPVPGPPAPRCEGRLATIEPDDRGRLIGTSGRDVIVGTAAAERIRAGGGRDLICAGGGADSIRAGRGRDLLRGQRGADRLFGGRAADRLRGGPGRDRLGGGPGADSCLGGPGADRRRRC